MPIRPIHPVSPSGPIESVASGRHRSRSGSGAAQPSNDLPPPDAESEDAPDEDSCEEQPAREYEVGYRRPPRQTQFKPGQSGNPKGRPKAAKGLHSIVRHTLTQKVTVRTASGIRKISRIEAVVQKTVEQAMKGNPRALAELIKLYGNAVPEGPQDQKDKAREEDLTATDLATLEELRRMMTYGGEETLS